MPEDQLMATQVAMTTKDPTGRFYGMVIALAIIVPVLASTLPCFTECPRGHKYFVGNVSRI